jgi:hypothetical protein
VVYICYRKAHCTVQLFLQLNADGFLLKPLESGKCDKVQYLSDTSNYTFTTGNQWRGGGTARSTNRKQGMPTAKAWNRLWLVRILERASGKSERKQQGHVYTIWIYKHFVLKECIELRFRKQYAHFVGSQTQQQWVQNMEKPSSPGGCLHALWILLPLRQESGDVGPRGGPSPLSAHLLVPLSSAGTRVQTMSPTLGLIQSGRRISLSDYLHSIVLDIQVAYICYIGWF